MKHEDPWKHLLSQLEMMRLTDKEKFLEVLQIILDHIEKDSCYKCKCRLIVMGMWEIGCSGPLIWFKLDNKEVVLDIRVRPDKHKNVIEHLEHCQVCLKKYKERLDFELRDDCM